MGELAFLLLGAALGGLFATGIQRRWNPVRWLARAAAAARASVRSRPAPVSDLEAEAAGTPEPAPEQRGAEPEAALAPPESPGAELEAAVAAPESPGAEPDHRAAAPAAPPAAADVAVTPRRETRSGAKAWRERRRHARLPLDEPILITPFAGRETMAEGIDVSLTGIRLRAVGSALRAGDLLHVTFNVGGDTVEAVARVRRTQQADRVTIELSAEFARIDPWAARLLEEALKAQS
jgi:hypothetical protein